MMRRILTGIFLLLISMQQVNACQCTVLPPLSRVSAEGYDVIFVGEVIAVSPGELQSRAKFKVITLFRGQAYQEIEVDYDNETSCGINFMPGETWTIYGKWVEYGVPRAEMCGHTRRKPGPGEQDWYADEDRPGYEIELKWLEDSLGVQPFLDPNAHKDMSHKNIIPGATQAITYLVAGMVGLALIFWFVRRLFRRDAK